MLGKDQEPLAALDRVSRQLARDVSAKSALSTMLLGLVVKLGWIGFIAVSVVVLVFAGWKLALLVAAVLTVTYVAVLVVFLRRLAKVGIAGYRAAKTGVKAYLDSRATT